MTVFRSAARRGPRSVLAALGTALSLALTTVVLAPTAAHASPVDITCLTGNRHTTYSPPLTNTPKPESLAITDNFSCLSLLSGVSSGTSTLGVNLPSSSCLLELTFLSALPVNYTWNTGQSSTITYATSNAVRAANGTVTTTSIGTVTAGLGLGQVATLITVEPALSPTACAGVGISATNSLAASLAIAPV
ncbi:hypothetical protein ACIF6H_36095 [Streptomyces microflavus]|uniref:hypothetical protein n=1 Tax=Streptomyces TaxID=1883 RepID=UPI000BEF323C|nr:MULTISPECIES: hypothetical protein [unclassified Streptomyces]